MDRCLKDQVVFLIDKDEAEARAKKRVAVYVKTETYNKIKEVSNITGETLTTITDALLTFGLQRVRYQYKGVHEFEEVK